MLCKSFSITSMAAYVGFNQTIFTNDIITSTHQIRPQLLVENNYDSPIPTYNIVSRCIFRCLFHFPKSSCPPG